MTQSPLDRWTQMTFTNKPIIPASQLSKKTGKPMYTKEELNVAHPLMKLWRHIVYEKQITYEYFILKWKEYCRDSLLLSPNQVVVSVGNIKAPLYADTLTMKRFMEWTAALGYPIVKIFIETIENGNPAIFEVKDDIP